MKSRSSIEIRRCRPLLGTFVEITASLDARGNSRTAAVPSRGGIGSGKASGNASVGVLRGRCGWGQPRSVSVTTSECSAASTIEWLQNAISAAFSAIERIQSLMSVHDPASELSLLNRVAPVRPVTVSRELFTVLRRADRLARESDGAFDYTVAPMLARWGLRPAWLKRRRAGDWRDVSLLPGRRVRFLQPLALDLGGIAKGYAVDAAIKILRRYGVQSAVVNAGGDLRVFGQRSVAVHLRHPAEPRRLAGCVEISEHALATSSPSFTQGQHRGRTVSHLVNSRERNAVTGSVSVSVRAPECWLADALTKVVLNAPAATAQPLLEKYRAEAVILSA